jgi:hypothetical protein
MNPAMCAIDSDDPNIRAPVVTPNNLKDLARPQDKTTPIHGQFWVIRPKYSLNYLLLDTSEDDVETSGNIYC